MIVSGFTQRTVPITDEELEEFEGCHTHCHRCRLARCTHPVDNVTACSMTSCQGCGFRFHECKSQEHALTCQEERVSCINSIYGCPHMMKRSSLSSHLPVCPASVVSCGEEWSRWPMYNKEKGAKHPPSQTKTYIDCGQLDVGLAMRDQRMLIDSLRAPAKLKRTLRNPLTQKYPAAPIIHRRSSLDSPDLHSGGTSQTVSDDDADTPWDLSRRHPGLKESISSHFVSVSQETKDALMCALNGNNISESSTPTTLSQKQDSLSPQANITTNELTDSTPLSKLAQCNITKHAQSGETLNETGSSSPLRSVRSSVSSEKEHERSRSRSVSVLRDPGGSQLHKILGVRLGDESEDDSICLHKILGVSLNLDVINKYMGKPAKMFTFICAQNFRRDQFPWHFKNVHEDITAQLDGFLEQRCPLAYAGCSFSFQRLIPKQPDTVLHFSWLQESFGLKSTAQPCCTHLGSSSQQNVNSNDSQSAQTHSPQITADDFNTENYHRALDSNTNNCNQKPSISDLGDIDRNFDQLAVNANSVEYGGQDRPSSLSPPCTPNSNRDTSSQSFQQISTKVQPVIYTACNPDSKVLLVYNVEDDWEEPSSHGLMDLPFEVLQQIARRLDSFSLCNLSLTCRLLRDVCCTLLDDFGIVMLNWERQKVGEKIVWRVANKRWIFSTSFEPIKSWKFNPSHTPIAEHLKVCPFNQDKLTHTEAVLPIMT